ncbi:hypothetical protein BH747_00345 [Enterococcus villorum]|uniref:Uncharacterized protein n=2 Tax=Enterococcus villorum TaxID=112904 RepID=A0A1V8YFA1_9ENTE|nr:hypothetical protein [Enterococcus villorum]EOH89913.1 hypothetical protein UAO_01157 [Enterococcus villorum ATCC 700913]EOW78145.1 hypothetical protein I591_01000 [Enterococcus villorum ATCC 700913]OQO71317.1 hypothetical protein BH747_00345 [Enterococcus villorum]OQO76360.1 hypothetical protein BH744_03780 [Enterococcus villorum]GEL90858.1 hypothetical protein EVI01_01950 [Enterococcus villorum]
MISIFTLLLFLFVLVMCLFLWLVRREIVYRTVRNRWVYLVVPFLAVLVLWFTLISQPTLDELAKGVLSAMIFISFLIDSRGMTEEGLVLNSFDIKGVPFSEINKIVLYQPQGSTEIKMNFFRNGWRGPMLKFSASMEELVTFLAQHLNEEAEIDIMIDSDQE